MIDTIADTVAKKYVTGLKLLCSELMSAAVSRFSVQRPSIRSKNLHQVLCLQSSVNLLVIERGSREAAVLSGATVFQLLLRTTTGQFLTE